MRLLYLIPESWPTHRADVRVLFGKYLPRLGVTTELVTDYASEKSQSEDVWLGGRSSLHRAPAARAAHHLAKAWHFARSLLCFSRSRTDAVQVRDMPVVALLALAISRLKRCQFYYWMSFPQSEGQIERARARGRSAGIRFWFPLIQGHVGKYLLYHIVLRRADHVFVQSDWMASDLLSHGVDETKITPVPMGVDLESVDTWRMPPLDDIRMAGRRVVAYLGTLDAARHVEMLFEMLEIARRRAPSLMLLLIGDTEDVDQRTWLEGEARRYGVADAVMWTGWVPMATAWQHVRRAEIGLSPVPRSPLFDCASPTKPLEYMALGVPVVASDNPDQMNLIQESDAGRCVPFDATAFAGAVVEILSDRELWCEMSKRGPKYVARKRGYDAIARRLAGVYETLLRQDDRGA